jgi:hypothetical protein
MRMMHPRLEEIRKRLLDTPVPAATPKAVGEVFSPNGLRRPQVFGAASVVGTNAGPSTPPNPGAEQAHVVEPASANMDNSKTRETPQPLDRLVQAVAELFEPARRCQEHLAEIEGASAFISQMTQLALELCAPLQSFHTHVRKLSNSFELLRAFRSELGVLADSFAPVRPLHQQVIQLTEAVRTHLAEVANGLEPAKALQADILELALALESVSELQTDFYALSKAFGDAADSTIASTDATQNSRCV